MKTDIRVKCLVKAVSFTLKGHKADQIIVQINKRYKKAC